MKALVYTGTQALEVRDVSEAEPLAGQCIVDISHCGICGSDMHAYHGHDARRVPPLVLGHEAVGVVRNGRFGGQRVAINPLMACGRCALCLSGREHLCAERELIGMRVPGAFAQSVAVSENNIYPLPDDLAFEQAALAEPLACAVHAVSIALKQSASSPEDAKVVVLGGGAIGLLCALVFGFRGVKDLRVAETNPLRRQTLEQAIDGQIYDPLVTVQQEGAASIVLDAVGSGITRDAASQLAAPGGVIVHIGLQDSNDGLDTRRLTLQEITFVGTYCYTNNDFAEALALLHSGQIKGDGWCELRALEGGAQAFMDIHDGTALPKIILSV